MLFVGQHHTGTDLAVSWIKLQRQAEAEVVPSSSLVEVEVEVGCI